MTTYTNTIGTGGDFTTLSLYWNTSATAIASGDVLVAEFLGGTHSIGATYNNTFSNLVGVDLVMKPVASAMHNGNWDEGVRIEPQTGQTGQMYFQSIGNQDFNLTIQDLVWINPHAEHGRIYVNFNPTLGSGAQYDATLSFERCLIHASGSNPYEFSMNANNYDASSGGGVSAFGNSTISIKDCVIEGFKDNGDVTRCFRSYGTTNFTYSAVGCTFHNATVLFSNTASAIENLHVHGCMFNQTGNTMQLGWESFNTVAGSTSSFSDIIWTRTDQANYVGDNWTTGASFNYDNTVTSGEVCFVGPSGPEGNYRLVADADNLAVRYMDLSSVLTADIAGVSRPGSTDAGAYQSVSNRILSATIGNADTSADYTSWSLFFNASSHDRYLNGDTFLAIVKSSGSHSMNLSYTPRDNLEIDLNFVMKGDVYHNGDWNSGIWTDGGFHAYLGRQNYSVTFEDLVMSGLYCRTNIYHAAGDFTQRYIGVLKGMETAQVYNGSINYKNLLWQPNDYYTFLSNNSVIDDRPGEHPLIDPNQSTLNYTPTYVKRGDATITYENCVLNGNKSGGSNLHFQSSFVTYGNVYNVVKGCTTRNSYFAGTARIPDGNVYHTFEGSLFGEGAPYFQSWGWWGNRIINTAPWWKVKDCIFYHASGDLFNFEGYQVPAGSGTLQNSIASGFVTNAQFGVNFNYDGSVKSGQVSFVSSTYGSNLDFRLVSDLDNLPVKYMTSGELSYKDITGYKRPAGTDQRDAGAFQSISDKVTVRNIGTSSADFTPDYATASLWDSTYYDNANVLNGETHVLRLKSGEGHSLGSLRVTMDGQANVNQSFILSGHKPHNGVWEEGAILDDQSGFLPNTGANNFSIKFKDIVVSGTTSGAVYTHPLTQRIGDATYEQGNAATEHTFEFENCLVRYISTRSFGSNQSPQLNYGNNKGYITDDDGNIIERGVTHHIFKNCVVIHPYPTSAYYGGFVMLGGEFASTNASATFLAEGCTFINTLYRNNRYYSNQYFSAIGCLIYNDPSAFGSKLGDGHSFLRGGGQDRDIDKFIIKDCIFNRGAGNALIPSNPNDDRLTFWIAEPLASEYVSTNTSASVSANANNYYWPRVNATNMSIRVPFNFDGTVSAGTVSFVSSATKDYRLVASEDNFASGYVSSFNLSGLDLAGNSRGDSPYDAGAFAITLQQVEDFLKSLGGPLVLQVGYRISNNRQRLNIGGGGEE